MGARTHVGLGWTHHFKAYRNSGLGYQSLYGLGWATPARIDSSTQNITKMSHESRSFTNMVIMSLSLHNSIPTQLMNLRLI